ncbi:HAD family hydrolase [Georgenia faecalis]|uniref:HAD family hydrolase n=1 Tax=Georgenia faecalis TaxID=2483799 RepID=A0ABV9DBA4_9MICO|nr:HAD family phosphatase [Georgenia faecalis]
MPSNPATAAATTSVADLALPAALLWDMDGTLVDTEPYWIQAEIDLAAEHGGSWTHEQALQLIGRPLTDSASILREQGGIRGTDDEIADTLVARVAERVRRDGPPWRSGSRELLEAARAAGVPCALVTMSYRVLAEAVLDTLEPGTFATVVTGDEVTHGKPHPEAYLTAAATLGAAPAECVALEDSTVGVAAAEAAGVPTIAVPLMVEIPAAPGRSRVRDVGTLTLEDLSRVAGGEVIERV